VGVLFHRAAAEIHRAERDGGDSDAGLAECAVLHVEVLLFQILRAASPSIPPWIPEAD
jgi:hypothetical protein